nr:hypothetical protein [Pseudonocardia sp. HH130629-09]
MAGQRERGAVEALALDPVVRPDDHDGDVAVRRRHLGPRVGDDGLGPDGQREQRHPGLTAGGTEPEHQVDGRVGGDLRGHRKRLEDHRARPLVAGQDGLGVEHGRAVGAHRHVPDGGGADPVRPGRG